MYCLYCGKELKNNKKKYCNNNCQVKHQRDKYVSEWKRGNVTGLKGKYGISNHIRNYLLENASYKCEICGWGEKNIYTGNVPLEIHHKDGNYLNNIESNLQVLCPNCHSLTNSYKNHNDVGRKDRKVYSLPS